MHSTHNAPINTSVVADNNLKPTKKLRFRPGVAVLAFGAALVGSYIKNGYFDDHAAKEVETIGHQSCAVTSAARPKLAEQLRDDCVKAVDQLSDDSKRDFSPRYLFIIPDHDAEKALRKAKTDMDKPLREKMAGVLGKRVLWDQQRSAIGSAIKNVVVGDRRPLAHTDIALELGSVEPITDVAGRDTGRYSGKFRITATDQGADSERVFEYDYATRVVTETQGSIQTRYNFPGITGNSTSSITGAVPCTESQVACDVVRAFDQALNSFSKNDIESLRANIAELKAYNKQPESYSRKTLDQVAYNFPSDLKL